MKVTQAGLFMSVAAAAVVTAIAAGLFTIGSPSEVRLRRLDEMRAEDLQAIARAILEYRRIHPDLPRSLDELPNEYRTFRLKDPSGRAYDYVAKDSFFYEICAQFDTEARETPRFETMFGTHGRGRQCFTLEARPPVKG